MEQKFVLTAQELQTLSAGLHNCRKGVTHLTLFYDNPEQKISLVLALDRIICVEADDRDLDEKDLDIINYKKYRLWQDPSIVKMLYLKLKWFFKNNEREKIKNGSK